MPTPTVQRTLMMAVDFIAATWRKAVTGVEVLPGMPGPVRSPQYAASITSTIDNPGIESDGFSGVVFTDGLTPDGRPFYPQPSWLENGKAAWDIKPFLLAGPKAKQGLKGPYATVPFRHGAAGGVGMVGQVMPEDIYEQSKVLEPTVEGPQGIVLTGGKLRAGTSGLRSKLPVGGMSAPYTWKASPYGGMVKVQQQYGKATQSKYLTFRRVSGKSDPNSWWHPGFQRFGIAQAVVDKVRPIITDQVRRAAVADAVEIAEGALAIEFRMGGK